MTTSFEKELLLKCDLSNRGYSLRWCFFFFNSRKGLFRQNTNLVR